MNLRRDLRPPMTILSVDANARRASACTVTRESTTDSKRDPSFVGSLHILCHTRLSERWGTLKPTCVPTNHLISLDYSGSSLHILCHTRLSERWGTLKPTCVPTNHLISLDYSGSGIWRHRYSLTLHIHQ